MISFLLAAGLLTGAGQGETPPPVVAVTTGGSWGFHQSPRKKTQWEEEVEAAAKALDEVTEAIKADIEPDIEPVPVKRVLVVDAPIELPPIDASGAIEAAKQAYFDALSEDDEDALNAILAAL